MSSLPAAKVCHDYLSVNPPDNPNSSSNRRRSTSVTPSMRSSRSHITVVEDHPELAIDQGQYTPEFIKKTTTKVSAPKYTWLEHLQALFGINVAKRKKPIVEVKEETMMPEEHEIDEVPVDETSSPWILPVYVYSSRKDTDKHPVVKEAKCTIDTGNHQGNIVSRDFVVNVLELPEANFKSLNEKEKQGAFGITGNKFIPEAAIYLTWYHKKSTRVFRDMRFLITPNQHCDLIIGAYSISANQLLDVPNLMARGAGHLGKSVVKAGTQDPKKTSLDDKVYSASKVVKELQRSIDKDKEKGVDTTEKEGKLPDAEKQHAAAIKALADYTAKTDSNNIQRISTSETITGTASSSTSTGTEKSTTDGESPKKRNILLRSPQAP